MLGQQDRLQFQKLVELLSPEENSNKYRKLLRKTQSPMIPFLGVHLGDLVFLTEAKRTELAQKNVDGARHRESQVKALAFDIDFRLRD